MSSISLVLTKLKSNTTFGPGKVAPKLLKLANTAIPSFMSLFRPSANYNAVASTWKTAGITLVSIRSHRPKPSRTPNEVKCFVWKQLFYTFLFWLSKFSASNVRFVSDWNLFSQSKPLAVLNYTNTIYYSNVYVSLQLSDVRYQNIAFVLKWASEVHERRIACMRRYCRLLSLPSYRSVSPGPSNVLDWRNSTGVALFLKIPNYNTWLTW